MKHSALEIELVNALHNFRSWLGQHDRGVLLGVTLSCIPLPPVAVIGFLVGCANYYLVKREKLQISEARLIGIGLFAAVINVTVISLLFLYIIQATSSIEWEAKLETLRMVPNWYLTFIDWFKGTHRKTI